MDFISKNNLFLKFSSTIQEQFCKINELYKVCYSVCENILSGCHIIKPLEYVIANEIINGDYIHYIIVMLIINM